MIRTTPKPITENGDRMNISATPVPSLADLQKMEIHPIAAMFPMLGEDELSELAVDISENGVNHPIVITREGVLIDGRNRLAACALAKVEPPVTYFEGDDPAVFIISENVNRRHLSKSQRAMAVAKAIPSTDTKGGRGNKAFGDQTVSRASLSQARTVIRLASDLVDLVLAGTMTVDVAYKQASLRKSDKEKQIDRLNRLSKASPESAEAVSNGTLTIDEAEQKVKEAEAERKQHRWAATKNLVDAVLVLDRNIDHAADVADLFDPSVAEASGHTITADRLRRVAAYAAALADAFEPSEGA